MPPKTLNGKPSDTQSSLLYTPKRNLDRQPARKPGGSYAKARRHRRAVGACPASTILQGGRWCGRPAGRPGTSGPAWHQRVEWIAGPGGPWHQNCSHGDRRSERHRQRESPSCSRIKCAEPSGIGVLSHQQSSYWSLDRRERRLLDGEHSMVRPDPKRSNVDRNHVQRTDWMDRGVRRRILNRARSTEGGLCRSLQTSRTANALCSLSGAFGMWSVPHPERRLPAELVARAALDRTARPACQHRLKLHTFTG